MSRRNYIFDTIQTVFKLYGYSPIQTPALENLSTLMGKYGEEGDKLLFKILNSGDYTRDINPELVTDHDYVHLTPQISDKGLRYDLTVPFARYVVQHRNDLQMPFKRYQIQPVWRADKPQKGRYREFYQCDADVVGSDSLLNEVELLQIIDDVFTRLKINITIKLNNRKILAGIAEHIGAPDAMTDITTAIDKIDKIGIVNVNAELAERGLTQQAIDMLQPLLSIDGTTAERLTKLTDILCDNPTARLGIQELTTIIDHINALGHNATIELDTSLARGLNYYTGTIIEVKANDTPIGSITGGGRYDNLTGVFGMPGLSGVGISFGADRIYDVLNTLDLYPHDLQTSTDVLFTNFGPDEALHALKAIKQLRAAGISCQLYPDSAKMRKQMAYADALHIPYTAIIGETEIQTGTITLKEMATGTQFQLSTEEAITRILTETHKQ